MGEVFDIGTGRRVLTELDTLQSVQLTAGQKAVLAEIAGDKTMPSHQADARTAAALMRIAGLGRTGIDG